MSGNAAAHCALYADLVGRCRRILRTDPLDKRGLREWLLEALDAAIRLEFSTIPPYLCAMWSIEDQSAPVADSIRRIVQEEMLHMALACNMLVGLNGVPRIAEPGFAPVYPGELAGGVHPGLEIGLSGLNRGVLEAFMTIELPEKPAEAETDELKHYALHCTGIDWQVEGHKTIGEFYDLLGVAFDRLEPPLSTDRQIAGPLAWFPVRDLHDVHEAIDLIKHQGEGSQSDPVEYEGGEVQLAHFYRFLEIHAGRRIIRTASGSWGFGAALEFPECRPMQQVPTGGYAPDDPGLPEGVGELLETFDRNYTRLLRQLGALWEHGDQGKLVQAIETMFSLQEPARALMRIPVAGGGPGTYGPCFRFREESDGH